MVGARSVERCAGICLLEEKNDVIFLHVVRKLYKREFFRSRATLGGRRVDLDVVGCLRRGGNVTPQAR